MASTLESAVFMAAVDEMDEFGDVTKTNGLPAFDVGALLVVVVLEELANRSSVRLVALLVPSIGRLVVEAFSYRPCISLNPTRSWLACIPTL